MFEEGFQLLVMGKRLDVLSMVFVFEGFTVRFRFLVVNFKSRVQPIKDFSGHLAW